MTLLAALSLALAGCDELLHLGKSKEDLVRERVDTILSAVQAVGGTTSDQLQIAIGGELLRAVDDDAAVTIGRNAHTDVWSPWSALVCATTVLVPHQCTMC